MADYVRNPTSDPVPSLATPTSSSSPETATPTAIIQVLTTPAVLDQVPTTPAGQINSDVRRGHAMSRR